VEAGGGGTDTIQTTLNAFTLPDALTSEVENLTFNGAGNFVGTGNALNNLITGGTGNDTLAGLGGADTLNGGAGADTLDGGAGNDTMNGGAGNDIFLFAPGFGADTIAAGFDANPTGGQDLLNIQAFGITAATFAAEVAVAVSGTSTLITILDSGDTILLTNVAATAVTAQDFVLSP
jgi:Ca2+-binding RTX toxin-like protein